MVPIPKQSLAILQPSRTPTPTVPTITPFRRPPPTTSRLTHPTALPFRSITFPRRSPLPVVATVAEAATYTLNLSGTESGPHTILSWTINWGDGSDPQVVTGNPSSVTHVFADGPNNYTISATATDDVATYSANTLAVQVTHVVPQLSISGASTVNEQAVYTLSLSGQKPVPTPSPRGPSTGATAKPRSSAATPPPSRTFLLPANDFTISASATDDVGTFSAADTVAVVVNHVPPTLIISGASTTDETNTYTLNLSGTETGPHTISSWTINWGDGSAVKLSPGIRHRSPTSTPMGPTITRSVQPPPTTSAHICQHRLRRSRSHSARYHQWLLQRRRRFLLHSRFVGNRSRPTHDLFVDHQLGRWVRRANRHGRSEHRHTHLRRRSE